MSLNQKLPLNSISRKVIDYYEQHYFETKSIIYCFYSWGPAVWNKDHRVNP